MGLSISVSKGYDQIPTSHWVLEAGTATVSMVSNIVCFLYVALKLEINVYIKRILVLATISSLLCQLSSFASVIAFNVWKTNNIWLCAMSILPKVINGSLVINFTMAIAVIRLHLATKTAKLEAINSFWINAFTACISLIVFGYASMFVAITALSSEMSVSPLTAKCAGRKVTSELQFVQIFGLVNFVFLIIGIVHDIKMARFLKDRQKVGPLQMAVWSTNVPQIALPKSQQNREDNPKLSIPVKATILGSLFAGFIMLMIPLYSRMITEQTESISLGLLRNILRIFMELYLPAVVLFSVKSNEKKQSNRVKAIPPRELQFHDEN